MKNSEGYISLYTVWTCIRINGLPIEIDAWMKIWTRGSPVTSLFVAYRKCT